MLVNPVRLVENGEEPKLKAEPVGVSLNDKKSGCWADCGTEVQAPACPKCGLGTSSGRGSAQCNLDAGKEAG